MIIPHDDKKHRGGEDAGDSCDTLLTVADGVGGWANKGVNPGLFSADLTKRIVETHLKEPEWDPLRLMFEGCRDAAKEHLGSATVVTLKLKSDFSLQTANLGDSGYALFHVNPDDTLEMYYRAEAQQKTHNFPY